MIGQYLQDEGFTVAATTLFDEANIKRRQETKSRELLSSMKRAVLGLQTIVCSDVFPDGKWDEVEVLCGKHAFRNKKSFLYAVFKQQYLELLEKQESQAVRRLSSNLVFYLLGI